MNDDIVDDLIEEYRRKRKAFSGFMNNVIDFFKSDNESLVDDGKRFVVHSIKHREKDLDHLREKIARKMEAGRKISKDSFFQDITDFCGVRVLHLRLSDFSVINSAISEHIKGLHWALAEEPRAYTWDPEYREYFQSFGIRTEVKESFYTSVHYLVKPNEESFVSCEIQVRSLFEEIWGEVDHDLNYPKPSNNVSCREQLKVLAKLVGAGTKLVDSIYSSNAAPR